MALLTLENLKKSFLTPEGELHEVIDVPSFTLEERQEMALEGGSGTGKTTFLNLLAGITRPDSGRIVLDGVELTALNEARCDRLRAEKIGYVFQTFNLLQGYSALENLLIALSFGPGGSEDEARALLERVGMGPRLHYRPSQLSVGQQQRVALARALAARPRLVLADEPTGNLDPKLAIEALSLLREICAERGAALMIVSHDEKILSAFENRVKLAEINRAAERAEAQP